jgi:hypothetical protein
MDLIEIGLSLIVGFAGGYALRAAISAARRRKASQLRRADLLRASEVARTAATGLDQNTIDFRGYKPAAEIASRLKF